MIILTDLSEVLIRGFFRLEESLKKHGHSKESIDGFCSRWLELETALEFQKLLRGEIREDEYWQYFFDNKKWSINALDAKIATEENLRTSILGTLDVFQRIIRYPLRIRAPKDAKSVTENIKMGVGRPEIWLISDHVEERIEQVHNLHPEVFEIISKEFWSCRSGKLKRNPGFFQDLLKENKLKSEGVIFIDDDERNTSNAELAGIASIKFESAPELESALEEYGFVFAPSMLSA